MVEISEELLEKARAGGWIGVDLDGTLFEYHGWVGWNVFGAPITPMIERVRAWLAAGILVKIVTARIGLPVFDGKEITVSYYKRHRCLVTEARYSDCMMLRAIADHCALHGLPRLHSQCYKDTDMIEQWDDRAVQVVPNTGQTLDWELRAELTARRGAAFQSALHETTRRD